MNLVQIRSAVPEIFHTQKVTDSAKNRTLPNSLRMVKTTDLRRRKLNLPQHNYTIIDKSELTSTPRSLHVVTLSVTLFPLRPA